MVRKKVVHIFFTVDDNYIPFLSTTIASIVAHASSEYKYRLTILHDGLSMESKRMIRKYQDNEKIFISFFNVNIKVNSLSVKLDVRDYYTITTYYRLFIPSLFPTLSKCLYLDSDIVLNEDVAKLYFTDLEDNLVGAIPDASVQIQLHEAKIIFGRGKETAAADFHSVRQPYPAEIVAVDPDLVKQARLQIIMQS